MKQVHLLVDFLVEVPDDEQDLDELFINIDEIQNVKVQKFNSKLELVTVPATVEEYETIDQEDLT